MCSKYLIIAYKDTENFFTQLSSFHEKRFGIRKFISLLSFLMTFMAGQTPEMQIIFSAFNALDGDIRSKTLDFVCH